MQMIRLNFELKYYEYLVEQFDSLRLKQISLPNDVKIIEAVCYIKTNKNLLDHCDQILNEIQAPEFQIEVLIYKSEILMHQKRFKEALKKIRHNQ